MRKVLILLGVISILSLLGAVAGSGISLPGSSNNTASVSGNTVQSVRTPVNRQAVAARSPTAAAVTTSAKAAPKASPTPYVASQLVTTHVPLVLLNPSSARPGSTVGVTGSGFTAGSTIDLYLKHKMDDQGKSLGFVQADKSGTFGGFNLALPSDYVSGPFILVAQEHNGSQQAIATGTVAANSPQVTFGTQVGKPGDVIAYSLKGFAPDEAVKIFFNSLNSPVIDTVHTDQSGNLRQDNLTVPFGAIGNNAFIFVGQKSQSPVTVSFLMLNLYPTITVNTYATRADSTLTFDGKGFGPNERVLLHLNSVQSSPVAVVSADGTGSFKNAAPFTIPFSLKGKNTFIAIGEQSQAPSTVSIDILPYTPIAETSTYGGRAGTTVTYYGTGFARDELVHVYVGRTAQSSGTEVSCFITDLQGNVAAAGSYTIQPNIQPGQLIFTLLGVDSQIPAAAKMQVMAPDSNAPQAAMSSAATKPFVCPYNANPPARAGLPTPTPAPMPPPGPAAATTGTGTTGQ
ncbi:MAG TPA: hypothetical protein VMW65_10860 [Chloroflexota bacterium]|nr:hypothetical protein [Chloroflexota bacterium]